MHPINDFSPSPALERNYLLEVISRYNVIRSSSASESLPLILQCNISYGRGRLRLREYASARQKSKERSTTSHRPVDDDVDFGEEIPR